MKKNKLQNRYKSKIDKPCWFIIADRVYQGVLKEASIAGLDTETDTEYRLTVTSVTLNGKPAKNLGNFTNATDGCYYSKTEKELHINDYDAFFSLQDVLKELRKQSYRHDQRREHWRRQYMLISQIDQKI